jgi:hypothetical protein
MMLINLVKTVLRREDRDLGMLFEHVADCLPEERILPNLCGKNHPRTGQKRFWRLSLGQIRIGKLFSVGDWVEFLVFNKLRLVLGDEAEDDIMWLDPISLIKFY